jgi:(S)-2-hydroxyglutarate dehydrogenase
MVHPDPGQDPRAASAEPPARCDLAIVGGGILGLALARELSRRHGRLSVCLFEREGRLGAHQTGHNSGVIHAGLYYAPGSLKARLCVQGASELYEYCAEHGIAHRACGKLVLATREAEMPRLRELFRRGTANGVSGLRWLEQDQIAAVEPHARGLAGLHSPRTGVVDFGAVAESYARDAVNAGARIVTSCEVRGATPNGRELQVFHARGTTEARHAIFCAGAWSDRLAVACGAGADPRIVPFRGAYLRLRTQRRALVRALIYPVPDPALPFLGVHLTRRVDDELLIGPTALIAAARDAYALNEVRARDALDTIGWPGTWRLLARHWRAGAGELHGALRPQALVRAAARYVPELTRSDVEPAFAGIRAQALGRDGRLLDEFVFSRTERALHVRNAPSPGATSSLAIARHVAEEAERAFDLRD